MTNKRSQQQQQQQQQQETIKKKSTTSQKCETTVQRGKQRRLTNSPIDSESDNNEDDYYSDESNDDDDQPRPRPSKQQRRTSLVSSSSTPSPLSLPSTRNYTKWRDGEVDLLFKLRQNGMKWVQIARELNDKFGTQREGRACCNKYRREEEKRKKYQDNGADVAAAASSSSSSSESIDLNASESSSESSNESSMDVDDVGIEPEDIAEDVPVEILQRSSRERWDPKETYLFYSVAREEGISRALAAINEQFGNERTYSSCVNKLYIIKKSIKYSINKSRRASSSASSSIGTTSSDDDHDKDDEDDDDLLLASGSGTAVQTGTGTSTGGPAAIGNPTQTSLVPMIPTSSPPSRDRSNNDSPQPATTVAPPSPPPPQLPPPVQVSAPGRSVLDFVRDVAASIAMTNVDQIIKVTQRIEDAWYDNEHQILTTDRGKLDEDCKGLPARFLDEIDRRRANMS